MLGAFPVLSEESEPKVAEVSPVPVTGRVMFSVYLVAPQGILLRDSDVVGVPRVFYDSPTGQRRVPLYRNQASAFFPYEGPSPLVLYTLEGENRGNGMDSGRGAGVQRRKMIMEAVLPADHDRVILLASPRQEKEGGVLQTDVLSFDDTVLEEGMVRMFNHTPRSLEIAFKDTPDILFPVDSGSFVDIHMSEVTDSGYPRMYVQEREESGLARLLHTNKLFLEEEGTNLFLILPRGERRVELQRLGAIDTEPSPSEESETVPDS